MSASLADLLVRRRMCRDFLGDPIPPQVVQRVLEAATSGPAAGNTHALDIVVLTGGDTERYWEVTLPVGRRDGFAWPGLLPAPVLALCYVDPGAYVRRYAEPDKVAAGLGTSPGDWTVPYWFVDGGAAVMAMLLAAEDAGLGALFFGQFRHEEALREAFAVPADRGALGTLALGRSRDDGGRRSRSAGRGRPRTQEMVHHGCW